jgi:putative two-component system response regulator
MNGFEVCQKIKQDPKTKNIPIVLVTGLNEMKDKVRGLEEGADDFLQKPFHPVELRARVLSLLRLKRMHDMLEDENARLEEQVRLRTLQLQEANERLQLRLDEIHTANEQLEEMKINLESVNMGLVTALEKANELNDTDTGNHIRRVCAYSEVLARGYGLPEDFCSRIKLYASLHDVGKVGIADSVLKKPGKFTPEEFEEMKRHTVLGYDLLKAAKADEIACNVALSHHEKYDGSGYPSGLKGEAIPIEARVVALADVWDALTNRRCYKDAFPEARALEIIKSDSGSHFDPNLVDCLVAALDEFRTIRSTYPDGE